MVLWTLFLLLDQATEAQASRECAVGFSVVDSTPCPASSPGSWIQSNDYPPSSLRNDEEGYVVFTLEVDENGKASGCSIDEPSPFPTLNETTCQLLLERARFIPPQNEDGENIASQFSSSVRWQIPDGTAEENWIFPHVIDLTITVSSSGDITDCEVHRLETTAASELGSTQPSSDEYCQYMMSTVRMLIPPDVGASFPQRFRFRTSVVPEIQP